jgi:hypothetical protein
MVRQEEFLRFMRKLALSTFAISMLAACSTGGPVERQASGDVSTEMIERRLAPIGRFLPLGSAMPLQPDAVGTTAPGVPEAAAELMRKLLAPEPAANPPAATAAVQSTHTAVRLWEGALALDSKTGQICKTYSWDDPDFGQSNRFRVCLDLLKDESMLADRKVRR